MRKCIVIVLLVSISIGGVCIFEGDAVDREFSWFIDEYADGRPCMKRLRNWYKAYAVSEEEVNAILGTTFDDYEPWTVFNNRNSFPDGFSIDGTSAKIFCARKKGSDEFDGVYIFVDKEACKVVLVWGRTYGV